MTEEEAKTKRCFHVVRDPRDRPIPMHPNEGCLGSACMAWRWMSPHHLEPGLIEDGVAIDSDGRVTKHGQRMGFCGLSGVPQ